MSLGHWLLLLGSLSVLGWFYLLLGRSGFWRAEPLLSGAEPAPGRWPDIVAVVPARNEASYVGHALRSLIGQDYPGRLDVVLVDDHSEDATRTLAQAVRTGPDRSLEVIGSRPLPSGWAGKLWAISEGLRHAARHMPDAAYVLLTDADIDHEPGNLRRLVAKAEADRLDLASLMVRLHCEHPWERLLIPPFVFFFRKLYPFVAVNRQEQATAAAAGGCALVRRDALVRAGGIHAIRDRVIDDVSLAERIKHHPKPHIGRIWLGLCDRTRSLRRQTRLVELWSMVARCADTQLNHSLALLGLTVFGMLVLYLVPAFAVLGWPLHESPGVAALGVASWICMSIAYWPTARLYGLGPHWILTLPPAAALYTAMTVDSALQYRRGKGGRWKGRIAAPTASGFPTPDDDGPKPTRAGLYTHRKSVKSRYLDPR